VLTFDVNVVGGVKPPEARELMDRMVQGARSIPGVRGASYAFAGGYGSGGWTSEVHAGGYIERPDEPLAYDGSLVGPLYFETMGIPILAGRGFNESDVETSPKVVVINQSMARHFWGNANPIGRRLRFQRQSGAVDAEVVGLVRDAQHHGARKGPPAMFYAPFLQITDGPWPTFALRTTGDPRASIGTLTRVLKAMQPGLVVQDATTLDEQVNASLARERLVATISGFFAAIALLLACIGVYGTLAYSVTRRTAEVGIRMTLGARRGEVLWMVLREALMLVGGGIVTGALTARAATKWIGSMLFGLQPGDLTTIAIYAAAMLIVALLAGYLPARRAASLDPMKALRYQ
jgi:predicted permease